MGNGLWVIGMGGEVWGGHNSNFTAKLYVLDRLKVLKKFYSSPSKSFLSKSVERDNLFASSKEILF